MCVFLKKAQSTLEYSVVIICVVAALLAMQIYLKRGFSGRLRGIADDLGQQYEPKKVSSDITLSSNSDVTTEVRTKEIEENGKKKLQTTTTSIINKEEQKTWGTETVEKLGGSLF